MPCSAAWGAKYGEAFLLSQLQGMRYVDIANELGVLLSSVKKYMAKATEACLLYELEAGCNLWLPQPLMK